ncbi:NGP1NT-domain-containing protein [Aspergillus campestris IBT 28561]|uniref:Nucleolar GTP-binding protein 2 n=1 Tax=Aspergillus campestris (strain IBT 28561) TaxID=1392248 RepID=A0A2I1CRQ2_ASPC2|nr:NGP1NT-domain-containing protein [Aspergillus campestris IBT 28561]PKY00304.1 NGP1NT-domain-containing protein [Aspergillus campestris IBT 28561]
MGTGKKERTRKDRQGKTGDGMANVTVKGENFYRDAKKVKTLNMFKEGKAQRDSVGNITKAASYQSRDAPVARIEPNRKWFGNTRVISQEALSSFREAVAERSSDPYSVLLKTNKLPMSLIRDNTGTVNGLKQHQAKMAIETSPYNDTFGPKAQRKRVKLGVASLEDLAGETSKVQEAYADKHDQEKNDDGSFMVNADVGHIVDDFTTAPVARESVFLKGQSKRIWNELYKVIDSSDVVIHVLDARDPEGTRCRSVEKYIREEAPHKHLIFVVNKCDLVPTGVAAAWVRHLSKDRPTLAFHASITNSFGKGSLIQLLRQFSSLHSDRKQIQVGFIGYPNSGKSSIINTLRKKKVCTVAPIPGETKVWQYITLMKRIYLIDCPGVVPPNPNDSPEDILLRGVVRVENVENPEQYIPAILKRVQPRHLERTYGIKEPADSIEFLTLLARKGGKLLRGAEPDLDGVAKSVINDFLRGKIPWFTPPPFNPAEKGQKIEGREGKLGEMRRKRKVEDTAPEEVDNSEQTSAKAGSEDEEFGGLDSDDDSIANLEVSDVESGEEND